jgi:lysophospholipase L1-like esterase
MNRVKTIALQLALSISSVVITMLLLEAGLVVARINTKNNLQYIPHKGTTYIPHAYYRHTKEGFSEGYINSHGFRDYERTYQKPMNTFRILVLGDSYTEALQVRLQNAFPALLEEKLNENSFSIRFEVLNLGQGGFGTADEYMRYLNFGVNYNPDLVLLAFLTGNDTRNNSKILNREEITFYFTFDKDGNLILDRSLFDEYERMLTFQRRAFQVVKQHSYLANLISERVYLLRYQWRERYLQSLLSGNQENGSQPRIDELSDLNVYLPDMSDRWKEAFAITKALLRKFRDTVEANGSRFLLVTLSNAEQVHPELQQKLKEKYNVPFDFEQPDRIIGELAKREQMNHLELMPAFREHHLRTGVYLHGFGPSIGGHWNEDGHRLAAEKIFDYLKEKELVPPWKTNRLLSSPALLGQ